MESRGRYRINPRTGLARNIFSKSFSVALMTFTTAVFVSAVWADARVAESKKNSETITLTTYYPSPIGHYRQLKTDTFEAKNALIGKMTPSYDSGWIVFPLVTKKQTQMHQVTLEHNLGTSDVLVQVEVKKESELDTKVLSDELGLPSGMSGPGVYDVFSGMPVVRFPTYAKNDKDITVMMPLITGKEVEKIFVRVVLWRY